MRNPKINLLAILLSAFVWVLCSCNADPKPAGNAIEAVKVEAKDKRALIPLTL